jgi:hypothetical protein
MRRLSTASLSLALVLLVSGCLRDTITYGGGTIGAGGTSGGIAGTWKLSTVNGTAPPFTYVSASSNSYVLVDDTFVLTSGGTWTETWQERQTISGTVTSQTFTDAGTFIVAGSTITFTSTVGSNKWNATYSTAGTLTMPGFIVSGSPVATEVFSK